MTASRASERQPLFVPCETFAVRAVLAPSSLPSRLEQLVLKALARGATSLETLDSLFGIGQRPMLRLTLDLLNRGYVTFNFATGAIRLTHQIVQIVNGNRFQELEAIERTEDRIVLMRDLIAGTILALRRRPEPKAGGRLPPLLEPASNAKISTEDVLRAIRDQLRRRTSKAGRPLQVLEVNLELAGLGSGEGEMRELELGVRVQFDEITEFQRILVDYPDDIPWRTRVNLERTLTRLANEEEPYYALKNLASKATRGVNSPVPKGLIGQLQSVTSLTERLDSADVGTAGGWQESLERAALDIEAVIGQRGAGELRGSIIASADRQVLAIRDMIRSARTQIVVACPFVRYKGASQFRDDFDQVLAKGRSIFFLFGIGDEVDFEPGVAAWLQDLKERYPAQVFFSRRSARCHAKFVVIDGHDAFVTSYNFLDRTPDDVLEVSVRLTASARPGDLDQPASITALELLSVAKQLFPDYSDGHRIIDSPMSFGGSETPPAADVPMPSLPQALGAEREKFSAERLKLWKRNWKRHAKQLSRRIATLGPTFTLVRDAEHRQLLYDALRGAQTRILVLSDQLSTRVIDRRFVDELQHCLERGVEVLLTYRRPDADARGILDDASRRYSTFRHALASGVSEGVESHAKVLVCDDWAIITSFNFLSFSGDYEGSERFRMRTELGVLFQDPSLVGTLLTDISQRIPEVGRMCTLEVAEAESDTRDQSADARAMIRDVDGLFEALLEAADDTGAIAQTEDERQRIGRVTNAWFGNASDPATAFRELAELEAIQAPFLEQAIAACLSLHPNAPQDLRTSWFEKLAEILWWERDDAVGLVLLLAGAPTLNARTVPPPSVAVLAGHYATGLASALLFDEVALVCSDRFATMAVTALAIQAAIYGSDPPLDALAYLAEAVEDPVRDWAAQAVQFRLRHPDGLERTDLGTFLDLEQGRSRASSARAELGRELGKCIGLTLDFTVGRRAWGWLVHNSWGFERLLNAVNSGDPGTVREFLRIRSRQDADDILDEAVREGTRDGKLRSVAIVGKHRRLCVEHISRVVRAARAWTQEEQALSQASGFAPAEAISDLSRQLRRSLVEMSRLRSELEAARAYPAPLMQQLFKSLDTLLRLTS